LAQQLNEFHCARAQRLTAPSEYAESRQVLTHCNRESHQQVRGQVIADHGFRDRHRIALLQGLRRVTGFTPLAEGAIEPAAEVEAHAANHPAIADELLQMGLRDGDRIAFIGYSFTEYWARLARLRIVAEIHWHDVDRFWNAPEDRQADAIAAFAGTGAVAVIAAPVEMGESPPGWQVVGDTGYLLYMLR
jgi:hypothetical protein